MILPICEGRTREYLARNRGSSPPRAAGAECRGGAGQCRKANKIAALNGSAIKTRFESISIHPIDTRRVWRRVFISATETCRGSGSNSGSSRAERFVYSCGLRGEKKRFDQTGKHQRRLQHRIMPRLRQDVQRGGSKMSEPCGGYDFTSNAAIALADDYSDGDLEAENFGCEIA